MISSAATCPAPTSRPPDALPLELHYQFVGARGAWRACRPRAAGESLYDDFAAQMSMTKQTALAAELDRLVYDEALSLFLCSP